METQFYYENKKILEVTDLENSDKSVKLEIKENEEFEYVVLPAWELAAVMTEQLSTASDSRNSRAIVITDLLYGVLKEKDVRLEDVSFVLNKLVSKLSGAEEDENNQRLGVKNKYEIRLKTHIDKD